MDKKRSFLLRPRSLSVWLAAGVGTFVLVGSIALIGFFQHLSRVEESVALESLGRTNALFLDQTRLPQSGQMAAQLGRVMGAAVSFHNPGMGGSDPADGIARRSGGQLRVGFQLKNGREVWFERDARPSGTRPVWKRTDALLALSGFWALALVFSLWLGSRVTRPLAKLAAALPGVGSEHPLDELPETGPREIVSLSSALRRTHASLTEEREKRRHAERLALLGRMATSLAHEVRNPVSAIRLHAQLLEQSCPPEEAGSAALIVAEAGRIESLVSQWLGYAKPAPVTAANVDVDELVNEARRVLEPQAHHSGVTLRVETDPAWRSIPVYGDRGRLLQVVTNLMRNAIQSMPKGGLATIRIQPGILEIADQGPGFSATSIARFAEPFHSEREGGMGLGLAVAKEIIESHGGTIQAHNTPQGGAVVRITWKSHTE